MGLDAKTITGTFGEQKSTFWCYIVPRVPALYGCACSRQERELHLAEGRGSMNLKDLNPELIMLTLNAVMIALLIIIIAIDCIIVFR